jgi:hypothetical protein
VTLEICLSDSECALYEAIAAQLLPQLKEVMEDEPYQSITFECVTDVTKAEGIVEVFFGSGKNHMESLLCINARRLSEFSSAYMIEDAYPLGFVVRNIPRPNVRIVRCQPAPRDMRLASTTWIENQNAVRALLESDRSVEYLVQPLYKETVEGRRRYKIKTHYFVTLVPDERGVYRVSYGRTEKVPLTTSPGRPVRHGAIKRA